MRFLAFLLCFLPSLSFAQTDDRDFLTALLEDKLSGAGREVRVMGFAGALSSRATIDELTIADDDGIWITLRDVELDWNRAALLAGRIDVTTLSAALVELPRLPGAGDDDTPSPEAGAFALPELPVSVQIGTLNISRVILGEALFGQPSEVSIAGSASLSGGQGDAEIAVNRVDGPRGQLNLKGSYANLTKVLTLDLGLSEEADGIFANLIGLPGAPAVDFRIAGEGPLNDFGADIRIATEGKERLSGRVTLVEATADQDAPGGTRYFRVDLGGDATTLFAPAYRDFFGADIRLEAAGAREPSGRLDLSDLRLQTQSLRLAGRVRLAHDGVPELIDLTGKLASDSNQPVVLPVPGAETRMQSADLALAYDARRSEGWKARLDIRDFDHGGNGAGVLTLSGSGRISGLNHGQNSLFGGTWNFSAQGLDLADPAMTEAVGRDVTGNAVMFWQGGEDLRIPVLNISGDGLDARSDLRIAGLNSGMLISGWVEATLTDLSRFSRLAARPLGGAGTLKASGAFSALSGAFDMTATVTGNDLSVDQPEADRLLQGNSKVAVSARRDDDGLEIRELTVSASTLSAFAKGWLRSEGSDLAGTIGFADLSSLGQKYSGSATARFTYVGDLVGEAIASAEIAGKDLVVGQSELDQLLRGNSRIAVNTRQSAEGIEITEATVSAATLSAFAKGWIRQDEKAITGTVGFSDLGSLGAKYAGNATAKFQYHETGPGRARASAEVDGNDIAIGLKEADKLLRGKTRVSLAATLEDGRLWVETAQVSNLQLSAEATAEIGEETRLVRLKARLADLALLAPEFPGPVTLSGQITERNDGYRLDLSGTGPGALSATVDGTMNTGFTNANLKINGSAEAALANSFIAPRSVRGPLRFDLALNGPLSPASLSGRVSIEGARLSAPLIGLALENGNVAADLAGGQARLSVEANVANGGQVRLTGPVGLDGPNIADLRLELIKARLRDAQLYDTRVSGVITITGPMTGGGTIAGDLTLRDTEIRVPSTGIGGSGAIPEITHVNEPAPVRRTRDSAGLIKTTKSRETGGSLPFALNITISAPNQIFIRGRGLDAEMGGKLTLSGTTDNVVPIGGLNLIRGRLDMLAKRFTLDEGSLRVQGRPIPYLSLRATSETEDGDASIIVEGDADAPEVRFTSSSGLPEEEVLARLLFGKGLGNLSAFQAVQLASAVATLAGKGGDGIVGKLRKGAGLDDLDVTSDDQGNTALRAGKYLSRNIYTDVVVDSEGKSEINLNIDISKSITLKGTAGSDGNTGIGIYLEKDY